MGAYAEAFNRDRWRIYKCEERLRVVNLGGTAIGTGLGAPRKFIFRVVDCLRENTGIGLARAENLFENTQNTDVFVEVSGILKACATNLYKVSNDLRLLSSGPDSGFGEINLPRRQAGSSIMPGKVNPVIPEGVAQSALQAMGNDIIIAQACSAGNLELNQFLPVVAEALLGSLTILSKAALVLNRNCVSGITANHDACRRSIENATATVTALLPKTGYQKASEIVKLARSNSISIKEAAIQSGYITEKEFEDMTSAEAVCRLGI
jgi:aspartate ammonia-lyase